jgi:uncharacterized protein (DUF427 family)
MDTYTCLPIWTFSSWIHFLIQTTSHHSITVHQTVYGVRIGSTGTALLSTKPYTKCVSAEPPRHYSPPNRTRCAYRLNRHVRQSVHGVRISWTATALLSTKPYTVCVSAEPPRHYCPPKRTRSAYGLALGLSRQFQRLPHTWHKKVPYTSLFKIWKRSEILSESRLS